MIASSTRDKETQGTHHVHDTRLAHHVLRFDITHVTIYHVVGIVIFINPSLRGGVELHSRIHLFHSA